MVIYFTSRTFEVIDYLFRIKFKDIWSYWSLFHSGKTFQIPLQVTIQILRDSFFSLIWDTLPHPMWHLVTLCRIPLPVWCDIEIFQKKINRNRNWNFSLLKLWQVTKIFLKKCHMTLWLTNPLPPHVTSLTISPPGPSRISHII